MSEPTRSPDAYNDATRRMTPDDENEAAHLVGMCWDWAGHPACDGYGGLSDFLMRCGETMKRQAAEVGRLRVAIRVNALRAGATDAEIDEVINGR